MNKKTKTTRNGTVPFLHPTSQGKGNFVFPNPFGLSAGSQFQIFCRVPEDKSELPLPSVCHYERRRRFFLKSQSFFEQERYFNEMDIQNLLSSQESLEKTLQSVGIEGPLSDPVVQNLLALKKEMSNDEDFFAFLSIFR
jgi:hypothetical protein